MLKTILSLQIVRQLLGAAGGALVALSLFTAYRAAAPVVTAYVLPVEKEAKEEKEAKDFLEADRIAVADVDIFDPDFELGADPVFEPTFVDPDPSVEDNSSEEESVTDAVLRLRTAAEAARSARAAREDAVASVPVPAPIPAPSVIPAVLTQQPIASPPPALPSSGIGMGLSAAAAMGLSAAGLRMRKRSRSAR